MRIAVVTPTISTDRIAAFRAGWNDLFRQHAVAWFVVFDGDLPKVFKTDFADGTQSEQVIDPSFKRLTYNFNDGVRNLAFPNAVREGYDIIITLDDDVFPDENDPILEHLEALDRSFPISWFNPFEDGLYMRGFPYGVRTEARAVVSHGVWTGIQDFDAPTSLVYGTHPSRYTYRGAIPKCCFTPVCGMNLAFRREVAPLIYFAPMGGDTGYQRFADIWMGIHLKRELDARGLALVHGFSTIRHDRKSNVFDNLVAEAEGIRENEFYWQDMKDGKYECDYAIKRMAWRKLMDELL